MKSYLLLKATAAGQEGSVSSDHVRWTEYKGASAPFTENRKSSRLPRRAIANAFRERNVVEMQAVGAAALNQAVKAVAIASGYVAPTGKDLICIPAFADIIIDGEERTAIKLIIQCR